MKFLESLLDLSVPKLYSKKQEKSSEFVDFFRDTLFSENIRPYFVILFGLTSNSCSIGFHGQPAVFSLMKPWETDLFNYQTFCVNLNGQSSDEEALWGHDFACLSHL